MDAHQSIQLRQSGTVLLLLEVLWFALIYSVHYTRVCIIRIWSRFCRIIYLLMNSECILIWLGTHSEGTEGMFIPDADVHFQMAERRHSNWDRYATQETTTP